jgi:hypothetical protein
MLTGALLVGLGSAPFWTFAVDAVRNAGLDQTAGRALLGVAGVTCLLAISTADVVQRLGATWTFVLCALLEAAAIATVGLAANHIVAVMVAAAAFGAAYSNRQRHGPVGDPALSRPAIRRLRRSSAGPGGRPPVRPAGRWRHR